MNILIADDERLILNDMALKVKELFPDARIDSVISASQSIELAHLIRYDVALLDIELPGTNGLELAKILQKENPKTNIIFITGYTDYSVKAFDVAASDYLLKPVKTERLKKAFSHLRHPIPMPEEQENTGMSITIGEQLRTARELHGLSVNELAGLLNVSRQTIHRYEHNERTPDLDSLVRLSEILDFSIDQLLKNM